MVNCIPSEIMGRKSMKIREDLWKRLYKIKADLVAEKGREICLDEAIEYLLNLYDEMRKERRI
jgi:hypothetical protein